MRAATSSLIPSSPPLPPLPGFTVSIRVCGARCRNVDAASNENYVHGINITDENWC